MSNNKPLSERFNSVRGKGPERWLSRTLLESEFDTRSIGPERPRPAQQVSSEPSEQQGGGNPDDVGRGMKVFTALKNFVNDEGHRPTAGIRALRQRLNDGRVGQLFPQFINRYDRRNREHQAATDSFGNIGQSGDYDETMERGKTFITRGLGYNLRDGKFHDDSNPDQLDLLYHGTNRGALRQDGSSIGTVGRSSIPPQLLEAAQRDPMILARMRAADTIDGVGKMSKGLHVNKIPWRVATDLFGMFARPREFQNFGKAGLSTYQTTPNHEHEFDPQTGEYTSFNSQTRHLQDLLNAKPGSPEFEEARNIFSMNHIGSGGANRGIANLQDILATQGRDGAFGTPSLISPLQGGTIDHGVPGGGLERQRLFADITDNRLLAHGSSNQAKGGTPFSRFRTDSGGCYRWEI